VAQALAMLHRALDHLNGTDAGSLPAAIQAEALRALEQAEGKHTAARARMLAAFAGQAAYESDGQGSARTWLRWQTRITQGAAAGAVGWVRRLAAHPVIGTALATGDLSSSWARQLCAWTDRLPPAQQADADEILAGAARGGVDLAGLGGLAQEMYERSHQDGPGPDDGFGGRNFHLGITFRGAGRAEGDLTPGCAAALDTVLESLGKKAGPEDRRTAPQRRHDALEDACQRLISGGLLPGRARQPAQVYLHMTLSQLRQAPGASQAEAAWAVARASQPGWLTGTEADAAACDARLAPVVTGSVDWLALDRMTAIYLAMHGLAPSQPIGPASGAPDQTGAGQGRAGQDGAAKTAAAGPAGPDRHQAPGHSQAPGITQPPPDGPGATPTATSPGFNCPCCGCPCPARSPLSPETLARLRLTMLRLAADVMSGPTGLAATLRAAQFGGGPEGSRSLPLTIPVPLDTGQATATIPPHLHRAVVTRHTHCCFPGCRVPATACDIHHITPRSRGGPTALGNLAPVCPFHHLTVIHRWGWTLHLHPDGTTTATSPNGDRSLHDCGPPGRAA
jgi:hypothetical protein